MIGIELRGLLELPDEGRGIRRGEIIQGKSEGVDCHFLDLFHGDSPSPAQIADGVLLSSGYLGSLGFL